MKIEFNDEEIEILNKSIKEYEENHWENEGMDWQRTINRLIDKVGAKE